MAAPKWLKPATALGSEPASRIDLLGGVVKSTHRASQNPPQDFPISAQLVGDDQCCVDDYLVQSHSPVLAMCRELIEAGFNPERPLHVYRDGVLALTVRSIGEAAQIEINGKGAGFLRRPQAVGTALPARFDGPWAVAHRPGARRRQGRVMP